jgi:hypothetical protein
MDDALLKALKDLINSQANEIKVLRAQLLRVTQGQVRMQWDIAKLKNEKDLTPEDIMIKGLFEVKNA